MHRLSHLTETILSGNRIVLSFKHSPRKPLGRRPIKIFAEERRQNILWKKRRVPFFFFFSFSICATTRFGFVKEATAMERTFDAESVPSNQGGQRRTERERGQMRAVSRPYQRAGVNLGNLKSLLSTLIGPNLNTYVMFLSNIQRGIWREPAARFRTCGPSDTKMSPSGRGSGHLVGKRHCVTAITTREREAIYN